MRVNQLVMVVPVPGPGMDDAAVRTEVWQQVSAFLLQYLGKRYVRFEPATLAWNQKVEQPFGVILGRSDPALFLYLYAMGKKFQDEAIQFHLDGFLKNMEVDQTLEHGRVLFCSMSVKGDSENLKPHLMWHLSMMKGELLPDCALYYLREKQAHATEDLDEKVLSHLDRYALCAVSLVMEERT